MTREMMRFHMQHFEGAHNQIRQARAMLKLLVEAQTEDTPYRMLLEHTYQRVSTYPDEYLYHDDLSEHYRPCYFHQFMDHAQQHQLQFVSEATFFETFARSYPPHVEAALRALGDNLTMKQQYLDFLRGRKFRQTLLCHQEIDLERTIPPERLYGLVVASPVRLLSEEARAPMQKFEGLRGSFAETDAPLDQAALRYLGEQWPGFVAFADLLDAARERIDETALREEDSRTLAETLLQLYRVNFLELHLRPPRFSTSVSERPRASPIARFQVLSTPYVSTLTFGSVRMGDPVTRHLLSSLDGTRNRAELLEAMLAYLDQGGLVLKQHGEAVTNRKQAAEVMESRLDAALADMAGQGLLLA
jgi:methyltransferase-like protein